MIDYMHPHYKSSPTQYLCHLIGHEGKNSLLLKLIDEGLAFELVAGSSQEMELFTFLNITIKF